MRQDLESFLTMSNQRVIDYLGTLGGHSKERFARLTSRNSGDGGHHELFILQTTATSGSSLPVC